MTHVLADLDGTLVDSGASILRAWRWWAARHGIDADTIEPIMHGRPSGEIIAQVAPHLDATAESLVVDAREAQDAHDVIALPGAAELLAGWPGDRLAIVTSCTVPLVTARLRATGLPAPAVLVTPERVRRGKPDPEGYLLAAAQLGAEPADCVVLEDAPAGVAAGRAAGMHVVGVLTSHTEDELPGADDYAPHVAAWLERARSG
jgi:mannitol-1-/sugar-/sorbitol-6-phosphatase